MAYESYNPNFGYASGLGSTSQGQQPIQQPTYQPQENTFSSAGEITSQVGQGTPNPTMNPYIEGGKMGMQAIGMGLDFYGKYQARQDAKQQHAEAVKRWEDAKAVEEIDRAREQQRQGRQEAYFAGDYSQGLEDRFAGSYGGYQQGGQ